MNDKYRGTNQYLTSVKLLMGKQPNHGTSNKPDCITTQPNLRSTSVHFFV